MEEKEGWEDGWRKRKGGKMGGGRGRVGRWVEEEEGLEDGWRKRKGWKMGGGRGRVER